MSFYLKKKQNKTNKQKPNNLVYIIFFVYIGRFGNEEFASFVDVVTVITYKHACTSFGFIHVELHLNNVLFDYSVHLADSSHTNQGRMWHGVTPSSFDFPIAEGSHG